METRTENLSTTQWKLDRLAVRGPEVVARHSDAVPEVGAFATSLPEAADTYRANYAAVDLFERHRRSLFSAAQGDIELLAATLKRWLPPLSVHLRGFDITPLLESNNVATDVLTQGDRLVERLHFAISERDAELPYAQSLLGQLEPLLERARASYLQARQAMTELSARREALRQSATAFNSQLIALRKVLRMTLGASHPDYQYLRTNRISRTGDAEVTDPNATTDEALSDTPVEDTDTAPDTAPEGGEAANA